MAFVGAGLLTASCKTAPVKPLKTGYGLLPALQQHVEPLAATIPSELTLPDLDDPVDLAIVQAQFRMNKGEELYNQGLLKDARLEFDSAVDVILETAAVFPAEKRLQRLLNEVAARVNALELVTLREGGRFIDQPDQPAAIDDLEHVETFPALIDPKFKKAVEDEVKELAHDLPIEINDRVLGFLDYYQTRGRTSVELGLERLGRYQPMIDRILKEEGVPLDLIYLCQAESAFEPRAVSRAAAKGMWQFISSRGKEYGLRQTWWIDERSDPEKSTRAAARHLKDLYQQFGDWYLAMAAYNSGPLRVQRAMEKTGADNFWALADKKALPRETINYVPNILALTIIGKDPAKYGFNVTPAPPLETERVNVDKATDLRVIAEAIHLPLEDLRALNSHVLRWTTPPDDADFQLILPKGYAEKFNEQIASLPESKRILFQEHVVRKGDTLSGIARKYGITAAQLAQTNNLGKAPKIKVGQTLVIPLSGMTSPPAPPAVSHVAAKSVVKSDRPTSYTVRAGDTLTKIAARFNTTPDKLKSWNHLTSSRLLVGKRLIVAPPPSLLASSPGSRRLIHQVQRGETLDRIAATYNTSVDAIISWNESEDLSVIHPGDRITIFLGDNN
jgi:membrane-bound lytic murein transglycosylase D